VTRAPRGRARTDPARASGLVAAALVGLALVAGGACAPSRRLGSPPRASAPIARADDPAARRGGTIVVGLAESVDPAHAPSPTIDSERLVFRNLYETLVRVGVDGAIHPGLASVWERSCDGREWTFVLRDGARLWDGTPLEPVDVRLSWMTAERRDRAAGRAVPWTMLDGGAEAVVVREDGRITARLAAPAGETPAFFAHPALAIADRRRGETWPIGTGAFRPVACDGGARVADGDLVCLPNEQRPRDDAPWVRLVFRVRPGADPRDLHAEGVDAFLVRDRATLAYFATVSGWRAVALPADRLYVFIVPTVPPRPWDLGGPPWDTVLSEDARAGLARDAVTSDAVSATSLYLSDHSSAGEECSMPDLARPSETPRIDRRLGGPDQTAGFNSRLLFDEDDEDARRLAERIVVLGDMRAARYAAPTPLGVKSPELEGALALGAAQAIIARVERRESAACAQLADLARSAPWLEPILAKIGSEALPPGVSGTSAARLAERLADQGIVIPLVTTRAHLVTRDRLAGVEADGDGAVRFDRAGWAAEASER